LFPEKKWLAATGAFSLQLFTNVTGDANAKPENGFSNTYFTDYTRPVFNTDGTKIGFGGRYEGQDILSVEYLDEYMGKVTVNGGKGGNRFGQYGRVVDLKFADRDRLIVASQNTVAYYDDDDEEIIRTEIQNLAGISLNRTNDLLVSVTTGGRLILMHFPQLERVTEIQAHSGRINQLVFHNEREVFATAGEDGKIKIWRIIGD
jgi:WD40 repeat protein